MQSAHFSSCIITKSNENTWVIESISHKKIKSYSKTKQKIFTQGSGREQGSLYLLAQDRTLQYKLHPPRPHPINSTQF
jgi:hypothetical protein